MLFEKFYGHAPEIEPLVEYRGLELPKKNGKGGGKKGAGAAAK